MESQSGANIDANSKEHIVEIFGRADAVRSAEGGEGGELVPVPPDLLASYGLEDKPFGDAHAAVMYVHALAAM